MIRELNNCWYLTSTAHIESRSGRVLRIQWGQMLLYQVAWHQVVLHQIVVLAYFGNSSILVVMMTLIFFCRFFQSFRYIQTFSAINGANHYDLTCKFLFMLWRIFKYGRKYAEWLCFIWLRPLYFAGQEYQHHSKCWNLITVRELVYICTWQIFCCTASLVACYMVMVWYDNGVLHRMDRQDGKL